MKQAFVILISIVATLLLSSCNPRQQTMATPIVNVDSLVGEAYQKGSSDEFNRWDKWRQQKSREASDIAFRASINNRRDCCGLASHILNEYTRALKVYYAGIPGKQ